MLSKHHHAITFWLVVALALLTLTFGAAWLDERGKRARVEQSPADRRREIRGALNQIRTELRLIHHLAGKVGGLPVGQVALHERFPDLERGKHYGLLSRELPPDLYDAMESVYEDAHAIRIDVDRRAAFGDTADVEHVHADRLKRITETAPDVERRLREYAQGLEDD